MNRRQLLNFGAFAALFPMLGQAADKADVPLTAASFRSGGLKGFAVGPTEKRGHDPAYFDALAETGANVARVFFPFRKCQSCEQWGRNTENVEGLRRILDWCRERQIKVVVTGDFDGTEKASFWKSAALRKSFVENWRWFAETFQNDAAVAGLDLLNEPNPPWPSGNVAEAHALWRPLAEQAIAAIRGAAVTLPIIYEGVGGGQAIGLRDFQPFSDTQVVYSFHLYTPHAITHQHVGPAWTQTIPYPAGAEWGLADVVTGAAPWNRKQLESSLRDVIAFQARYKAPIYVGEFSCVRWAPRGSAERYIEDCLEIFEKFGWSWSYHEFRGWPGWDAEIDSESPTATIRSTDAPLIKLLRSKFRTSDQVSK